MYYVQTRAQASPSTWSSMGFSQSVGKHLSVFQHRFSNFHSFHHHFSTIYHIICVLFIKPTICRYYFIFLVFTKTLTMSGIVNIFLSPLSCDWQENSSVIATSQEYFASFCDWEWLSASFCDFEWLSKSLCDCEWLSASFCDWGWLSTSFCDHSTMIDRACMYFLLLQFLCQSSKSSKVSLYWIFITLQIEHIIHCKTEC